MNFKEYFQLEEGKFKNIAIDADYNAELKASIEKLQRSLKWHISRAGSGGSHEKADQLVKKINELTAELEKH